MERWTDIIFELILTFRNQSGVELAMSRKII